MKKNHSKKQTQRKNQHTNFRKQEHDRLLKIADVLEKVRKEFDTLDLSPLKAAATQCLNNTPDGLDSWGYQVDRLLILFPAPRHTIPQNVENVSLEISIDIRGKTRVEGPDPFTSLAVDFLLSANTENDRKSVCSWHFDRHKSENSGGTSTDAHPLYHFQFGGKILKSEIGDEVGQIMILDSPRLAAPPMDVLLSIDFALSNFLGEAWRKLGDTVEYPKMVLQAQELYWQPYVTEIMKLWGASPLRMNNTAVTLWPQLVKK